MHARTSFTNMLAAFKKKLRLTARMLHARTSFTNMPAVFEPTRSTRDPPRALLLRVDDEGPPDAAGDNQPVVDADRVTRQPLQAPLQQLHRVGQHLRKAEAATGRDAQLAATSTPGRQQLAAVGACGSKRDGAQRTTL